MQLAKINTKFWSCKKKENVNSDYIKTCLCVFCGLVICLVLALVYTACRHKEDKPDENTNFGFMKSPDLARMRLTNITSGCGFENCSFVCANTTEFNQDLCKSIEKSNCSIVEILHIERQFFPNQTLSKGYIDTHINFLEISLANSNMIAIENEAFNEDAFTSTFSLSLTGLPIKNLTAGILLGLSNLTLLTIMCPIENINRGFFQPVSSSLRYLKMNYLTDNVEFDTIFGISKMSSLSHLDLSSNNFPKPLTIKGFHRLVKIEFLNLSNSKITAIGENAFDPIKNTVKYLDLSHNYLTQIGTSILDGILSRRKAYIYLGENPWLCTCEIATLVEYYKMYPEMFLDKPYCKSPQELYGTIISENLSCPRDTTIIVDSSKTTLPVKYNTTSTKVPGRDSTEEQDKGTTISDRTTAWIQRDYFKVACAAYKEDAPLSSFRTNYDFLKFQPPRYEFEIILINHTAAKVEIREQEQQLTVLWHSDLDDYNSFHIPQREYGCRSHYNESIIVTDLKDNVSYTFCLIPEGEVEITPFNCQPFHVPVARKTDSNAWISADKKHLYLSLVTIIILASLFVGGILCYFIIKLFPNLLKGSKHVLIVKKENVGDISTISGKCNGLQNMNPITCRKKITPPPPYQSMFDEFDSMYEDPLEMRGYETPRRHTYCFNKYESIDRSPKSPPPLPKRNSEPTYSTISLKGILPIRK